MYHSSASACETFISEALVCWLGRWPKGAITYKPHQEIISKTIWFSLDCKVKCLEHVGSTKIISYMLCRTTRDISQLVHGRVGITVALSECMDCNITHSAFIIAI